MSEPSHRALRLAREAEGYHELDLFEEVLARAERLLEMEELTDFALMMRAESLRGLDRWAEGAGAFEEVLARQPDNIHGYVGLGWCRKRTGDLPGALKSMERLLSAREEEPIGLFNLACYCALDGQRARALDLLGQVFAIDPDYRKLARTEEDLDALRGDEEFDQLMKEPEA